MSPSCFMAIIVQWQTESFHLLREVRGNRVVPEGSSRDPCLTHTPDSTDLLKKLERLLRRLDKTRHFISFLLLVLRVELPSQRKYPTTKINMGNWQLHLAQLCSRTSNPRVD